MRRIGIICCGLALVALAGCCARGQWTAGVCDCNPPPVASVLAPIPLPPHLCKTMPPTGAMPVGATLPAARPAGLPPARPVAPGL